MLTCYVSLAVSCWSLLNVVPFLALNACPFSLSSDEDNSKIVHLQLLGKKSSIVDGLSFIYHTPNRITSESLHPA